MRPLHDSKDLNVSNIPEQYNRRIMPIIFFHQQHF